METKTTSYAGMLNQSEFKQWHEYTKHRITYQYSTEEVSFLMSKAPYYFSDFEIMSSASKLSDQDITTLSGIFFMRQPEDLKLGKDDFGLHEKRIIRVKRLEVPELIYYTVTVPWSIDDKYRPLKFYEVKKMDEETEKAEALQLLGRAARKLLARRFFRCGRLVLDIYQEAEKHSGFAPEIRPIYLKQILYKLLDTGELTLTMKGGQLYFQEK